ncbi:unnamed protein product [Prorocentrum cordatum]|uniref:Nuclear pore complex protein Nup85 n=1 Tax=Prorocentrum cordatum TaxID=2364126 RepID=A0ABN9UPP3_9DINO|nr:unnamed protein product [Polarella glacialis]
MEHPTAPLPLRLAACASLAAAPWLAALAPQMLRALSLRARHPAERLEVLAAHVRMSSSSARSSPESAPLAAALVAVFEEVKAFGDCAEDDRAKLQAVAWESSVRVAEAALAAGLAQRAKEWASWAAHFCEGDAGRLADARLLVALCHLSCGLREEALAEAGAALAGCPGHAPALELLQADAARRGDRAGAAALLAARPRDGGSLAARAGALVRTLRNEVPAGRPPEAARTPARVLRSRLQLAVALQMPASEVTELLSAFATLLEQMQISACSESKGGSATEEAEAGTGAAKCAARDEAWEVVRLTNEYAEACRRDGAWNSCGEVLEALSLLQHRLGAAPLEQARCLVHRADALVCGLADEESSSDLPGGPAERAGALVQEARQLLSLSDHCGPGQQPDWGRLRDLAWLLEMKLCCRLGTTATAAFLREVRLAAEGPQGPAAEPPPPLLLLAQAAPRATPAGADVASLCLRLRLATTAQPAKARAGTAAVGRAGLCRQLLDLLPQQEERLEAVRDLYLQWHLEGSGQGVPAGGFGPDGEEEVWWLLAFSWDSASRSWLCGDHRQSKAWADVGVGLLQACSKAGCLPSSIPLGGPTTTRDDGAGEA